MPNGEVTFMQELKIDKGFSEEIRYLTQQEVAERFRVALATIKAWRDAGKAPVKTGME
jgi:hypothetical protein